MGGVSLLSLYTLGPHEHCGIHLQVLKAAGRDELWTLMVGTGGAAEVAAELGWKWPRKPHGG